MRTTARRISDGQALRDAMKAYPGGMTLEALSSRTKQLDPAGEGVSRALLGFLTALPKAGRGRFRDTTSPESAALIEEALDARPGQLFTIEEVAEAADRRSA